MTAPMPPAPLEDRKAAEPVAAAAPPPPTPTPAPYVPPLTPSPPGWYPAVAPPPAPEPTIPTSGQRLGLAIASLALLIPLLAIALGITSTLLPIVPAGWALLGGLLAATLVCFAVVAVNVVFNAEALKSHR